MKQLLYIIIMFTLSILGCKALSYYYNYTEHTAYIYKFKEANGNYGIIFKDKYQMPIYVTVDSADYWKYADVLNRKKWYNIRTYDDGRTCIIGSIK